MGTAPTMVGHLQTGKYRDVRSLFTLVINTDTFGPKMPPCTHVIWRASCLRGPSYRGMGPGSVLVRRWKGMASSFLFFVSTLLRAARM
jgi:hypothetical protein